VVPLGLQKGFSLLCLVPVCDNENIIRVGVRGSHEEQVQAFSKLFTYYYFCDPS
jgi:hypothetical protein